MSVRSDAAPAPQLPPARPDRTRWLVLAAILAVLLVTVAVVLIEWVSDNDGRGGVGGADRVVSGPREGREQATLVLLDTTASVTVRTRDLGDRLYRVETPTDGRRVPQVAVAADEVKLTFADTDQAGASTADIQLSSAVRWQIRVLAGAAEQVLDLTAGKVSGIELAGGATRIDLALPPPNGTCVVRMSGGVGQLAVHQVGDAPVRVRLGSGAASVTVDGTQRTGIAGGTVLAPPGWDAAGNRVDIDAVAGLSSLVVDRR